MEQTYEKAKEKEGMSNWLQQLHVAGEGSLLKAKAEKLVWAQVTARTLTVTTKNDQAKETIQNMQPWVTGVMPARTPLLTRN